MNRTWKHDRHADERIVMALELWQSEGRPSWTKIQQAVSQRFGYVNTHTIKGQCMRVIRESGLSR